MTAAPEGSRRARVTWRAAAALAGFGLAAAACLATGGCNGRRVAAPDARPAAPPNLLRNGDAEAGARGAPEAWRAEVSGDAEAAWEAGASVSGARALVARSRGGAAAWSQEVPVEAGLRYRVRAHVLSAAPAGGDEAIAVVWLAADGREVGRAALAAPEPPAWAEVEGTATAPADAAAARVALLAPARGERRFDDLALTPAEPDAPRAGGAFPLGVYDAPARDAVVNGSFGEEGAPGTPAAWQRDDRRGGAAFRWLRSGPPDGGPGAEIALPSDGGDASWLQVVTVVPGRTYRLRAALTAPSAVPGSHAVELAWGGPADGAAAAVALAAADEGALAWVASGPIVAPPGVVTATVRARARAGGTWRVWRVALVSEEDEVARLAALRASGLTLVVGFGEPPPDPGAAAAAGVGTALALDAAPDASACVAAQRPGAVLWRAPDEAATQPSAPPLGDLQAAASAARACGGLPVWENLAPAPPTGARGLDALRPWAHAADVVSMDLYPGPGRLRYVRGPEAVADLVDRLRTDVASWDGAQRRPIWAVLQGVDARGPGDHAVRVRWRDARGTELRADAVAADRRGAWRDVALRGLTAPDRAASAELEVEVADPAPGEFRFEAITLGGADGGPPLAAGGPLAFLADAPGRTVALGRAPVVPGRRYDLAARVFARARPDLAESRFMAYAAIIHGARGLLWWGTHTVPDGDPIWLDVAALARELSALGPALLGPRSLREVVASDPALEAALLQDGDRGLLLLAANRSRAPVRGRLAVRGLPLASCRRADGSEQPMRKNRIEEEFEPLGVRAWRLR